ncbi:MAG: VTT domain-containing protein, partial [Opitutales bacterium]
MSAAGVGHLMETFRELLLSVAAHNPFWALLALALLPGIGFPVTPLLLVCGAWGAGVGIPVGILGLAMNTTWVYFTGHAAGPAWIERLPFSDRLPRQRAGGGAAWKITLFVRLLPGVPLFVQTLFLGALRVRFVSCLVVTTLYQAIWVVALVTAGVGILKQHTRVLLGAFFIVLFYMLLKYFFYRL